MMKFIKILTLLLIISAIPLTGQDVTAPELAIFSMTPDSVDVSVEPDTIRFTVAATDADAGLLMAKVFIFSPSQARTITDLALFESGAQSDTVIIETVIEKFAESGDWVIDNLQLYDTVGNSEEWDTGELWERGFPTFFKVKSNQDITPPVLTHFSFSPQEVDVSTNPVSVTIDVSATDDFSGLNSAYFQFSSPGGNQLVNGMVAFEPGSTADSGQFTMQMQPFIESGEWRMSNLTVKDVAGNEYIYYHTDLFEMGFPFAINVTSVQDLNPPEMTDLTFSSTTLTSAPGSDSVEFTLNAIDDVSGLDKAGFLLQAPSNTQHVFVSVKFQRGVVAGSAQGTIKTEQLMENGDWFIYSVHVFDIAGNQKAYDAPTLNELGLQVTLHVDNTVSVQAENTSPESFNLIQNYPNPFNPKTTIEYQVPHRSNVEISLYDLQGRRVKVLYNGNQHAGYHKLIFDAQGLPSGTYFYELKTSSFRKVLKCLLIR